MEILYSEVEKILDVKYFGASTIEYTLPIGIHKIGDNKSMLDNLLPNEVKVNITIDDIRLKSNLTTNRTITITKRSFFYIILGFTQSHSGPFRVMEGFVQLIPDTYKSDKPTNFLGIDKIHLNCDCIQGSIVNGIRESILFSFALDKPPGQKIHHTAKIKLLRI